MEISGDYTLYAPREQVWDALFDPDTLKRAVPGCESLERTGDNEYVARLTVETAGIKGTYDGTLKTLDAQKPESVRLVVDGAGARGIMHGDGTLRLEAQGDGTTVIHYAGQAQLGGTIASIGMGVARHEATRLINECFARLAKTIGASVPNAVPAAASAASVAATATPAATAASSAPGPASDALATPAAAPRLDSSLPRTAPIVSHEAPAAPAEAMSASATPATPSAAPAAPAPPQATPAAQDHQQQSGLVHWFRRLLRLE